MKRQYLGDSKDSFKWDYLHYLVEALDCRRLNIAWMMTADDNGPDGWTRPERFPARPEILSFCNLLRSRREPELLSQLPATTGAGYEVTFHKSGMHFGIESRLSYFTGVERDLDQVLFLDPDNGFEPEGSCSEKHVSYSEIERVITAITPESVVCVFQHHRRKEFPDDFTGIRKRLQSGHSIAIYWQSVMIVCLSSSHSRIERVSEINLQYSRHRPVKLLT